MSTVNIQTKKDYFWALITQQWLVIETYVICQKFWNLVLISAELAISAFRYSLSLHNLHKYSPQVHTSEIMRNLTANMNLI